MSHFLLFVIITILVSITKMSVDTYHVPSRTRQMIVDQYMAEIGNSHIKSVLSKTYSVSMPTINGYTKRYVETGRVSSACE